MNFRFVQQAADLYALLDNHDFGLSVGGGKFGANATAAEMAHQSVWDAVTATRVNSVEAAVQEIYGGNHHAYAMDVIASLQNFGLAYQSGQIPNEGVSNYLMNYGLLIEGIDLSRESDETRELLRDIRLTLKAYTTVMSFGVVGNSPELGRIRVDFRSSLMIPGCATAPVGRI